MTRLPALNAKTLDKILFNLGFKRVRKKVMHSTDILMEDLPPCHIMPAEISPARFYGRYLRKSI